MKKGRQEKIIELIAKTQVETQEELAELLNKSGFRVTQATVSRDIKELKLSKVSGEGGRQYYQMLPREQKSFTDKYTRVLREGLLSMDSAGNILVIRTMSGMANAVAAALDHFRLEKIVGTIAGDDTIMCVTKEKEDAQLILESLEALLGK